MCGVNGMKYLMIMLILTCSYAHASEIEIKDKNGKVVNTIDKHGTVKDKNGYPEKYITKNGDIKNMNGKTTGSINVRRY